MLFLSGNVVPYGIKLHGVYREKTIPRLPCEIDKPWLILFDPKAGRPFDFLYPISLSNCPAKPDQLMNVIVGSPGNDGGAIQAI
jgi:hypothetical protein